MRSVRTISLLAGILALALGTTALACDGNRTKVSGTFDASGRFVLNGAWDAKGAAIPNTNGMVLQSFTTDENLVISASTLAGKAVCLFGDLDAANKTMNVSGYKECGGACDPAACGMKGAAAAAGSAGACASKASMQSASASHCAAKGADAAAASAGHCGAKGAAAKTASASSAGCCPSGAAAKTASAGSSCADGAAAKSASAKTASNEAGAAKATLVYAVSGMTCGGCASQVKSAVSKMANVGECTVDLEKAQAVVTTTGEVDAAAIEKAITAAGFPATLAPAEPAKS